MNKGVSDIRNAFWFAGNFRLPVKQKVRRFPISYIHFCRTPRGKLRGVLHLMVKITGEKGTDRSKLNNIDILKGKPYN